MIKKYYKINFRLESPLALGNGENQVTDSDVVKDSRGIPYIPASSLTGVYRRLFTKEQANSWFGETLEGTNSLKESSVITYDAELLNTRKAVVSKRDMVRLDENKIACDGAKFDFEIVEPGAEFVTYLEQDMENPKEDALETIANAWLNGSIALGAKTTRGYGRTKAALNGIGTRQFDLSKKEELDAWLDFDLYSETAEWDPYQGASADETRAGYTEMKLVLHQKGGISIRQYSTDVNAANYMQLALTDHTPVIPGTSWAGAFRHHMRKLGYDEEKQKKVFGTADGETGEKSSVRFTESQITGGTNTISTRAAIDRFTGGVIPKALYSEKAHYNGKLELTISFDRENCDQEFRQYLAAAVIDLHEGYLAVGGLTSIGRGMFEIEEILIDGKKLPQIDYPGLLKAIS